MTATVSWTDIALRLGLALLAGAAIGMDRGAHAQPAGLRTTVLVTIAAAVAMIQANLIFATLPDLHNSELRLDMMRLPLGILSGIGFIGAGAILRRDNAVRGVTTAATMWLTSVIGLCFGGGQLGLGLTATATGLATLWLLKYVEELVIHARRGIISVTFEKQTLDEIDLLALLGKHGFHVVARRLAPRGNVLRFLECSGRYRGNFPGFSARLVREISRHPGVSRVEWRDID